MDPKELKRVLAGLGIAGLIAGAGLAVNSGKAFGSSG
jgi:radical SAM modification target selenobiotic family peptide